MENFLDAPTLTNTTSNVHPKPVTDSDTIQLDVTIDTKPHHPIVKNTQVTGEADTVCVSEHSTHLIFVGFLLFLVIVGGSLTIAIAAINGGDNNSILGLSVTVISMLFVGCLVLAMLWTRLRRQQSNLYIDRK